MVVGGVAIVLGLCASLLHAMFRLDRAGRGEVRDAAALGRLSRTFRDDVRAATGATPAVDRDEAPGLDLTLPDGAAVSYRLDGPRLLREETASGTFKNREGYAIDRLGPVRFGVDGGLVRLRLGRRPGGKFAANRPPIEVDAWLGKDRGKGGRP